MDGPELPEAYGRVTDPGRFAPVVEAAERLLVDLPARYDAVVVVEPPRAGELRAARIRPVTGAALVLGVTGFPGVRLRAGHWYDVPLPRCGCDACGETAATEVEELERRVGAVVAGGFTEVLTRRELRTGWQGPGWSSSGSRPLSRHQRAVMRDVAPRGTYAWEAWPVRA